VVLAATGSGNTLTQPGGSTNASGVATGTLSSTVAETKTVSATIGGTAITQTATVTVTAGSPATSFVQSAGAESDNAVSSISKAFTSNVTAGNTLIAVVSWEATTDLVTRVTDACGQTWIRVPNSLGFNLATAQGAVVYYFPNTAAGPCTVTATLSAPASYTSIGLHEYTGTLTPDVASANAGASSTTVKSPQIIPTRSGELLLGYTFDTGPSNTTITQGSNVAWVKRLDWGHPGLAAATEDFLQSTAAPVDAQFIFGTANPYLAGIVAFVPSAP